MSLKRQILKKLLELDREHPAYRRELRTLGYQLGACTLGDALTSGGAFGPKRWTAFANLIIALIGVEKDLGASIVLPFLKIPSNFLMLAENLNKVLNILEGFPGAWFHSRHFAVSISLFAGGKLDNVKPATVAEWFCGGTLHMEAEANLSVEYVGRMRGAFGDEETFEILRKVLNARPLVLSKGYDRLESWQYIERMMDFMCQILPTFPRLTEVLPLPPPIFDLKSGNALTYTRYDAFKAKWVEAQNALAPIKVIGVMKAAWLAFNGKPPAESPAERVAALARTLSLRRFCRIRGVDSEDMLNEVVEPFARDIVRFL
jgi:hypothetical protein